MTSKIISSDKKSDVPNIYKRKKIEVLKDNNANNNSTPLDLTQLSPPYDIASLRIIGDQSTTLNQTIAAYAHNIAGFGIGVRYKVDDTEETEKMASEKKILTELANNLNLDRPAKEVIEEIVRHVEECGNGYFEIVRDGKGDVVGIDNLKPEYVTVTKLNKVIVDDQERKFRYYCYSNTVDEQITTTQTWFKSFGDPTPLNKDGTLGVDSGTATEVVHLKIGDDRDPYGVPRYIGALINILGDRKANELNYRYFVQGRHIPLAFILENAQLTEESENTLTSYANSVGTEDMQHKFLVLEAEKVGATNNMLTDDKDKASIRVEKLADIIQKDALFLEYSEKVKENVLSAFRLPPVFIGLSEDYNRSTVETARELTEEQVFQPRREGYEWRLNNILKEYAFEYVELYLKSPNLTNMDDVSTILSAANDARGVAPNDVRELLSKAINKPLEPFEGDEYNYPLGYSKNSSFQPFNVSDATIEKAYGHTDESELAATIRRLARQNHV